MENKHFKLSENECKTVKAINEFTNKIIESAMDRIDILFQNRKIYINEPINLKKALNNLYFFNNKINQMTYDLLEDIEIESVNATSNGAEDIRYYCKDNYELIMNIVYLKEDILLLKRFEMCKYLTIQGFQIFKEIIEDSKTELSKYKEILKEIYTPKNVNYRFLRIENMNKYLFGRQYQWYSLM